MAAADGASLDCAAARCDGPACHDAGLQETQGFEVFEFEDFLQHIGVDPCVDSLVMVAACHMYSSPLPPEWLECCDAGTSAAFFYNRLTGESRWAHPQEATFRELIGEVGSWRPDDSLEHVQARSEAHLRGARERLLEALAHWSGPHVAAEPEETGAPAAPYFFNAASGESHWLDPRLAMEFDLLQRHEVLRACLAEHLEGPAGDGWGCSSDEEGPSPRSPPAPRAGARPPRPEVQGSPRSPQRARLEAQGSPCSPQRARAALGRGDESVRSCATYLSACSDAGAVEELGLLGLGMGLDAWGPACIGVA